MGVIAEYSLLGCDKLHLKRNGWQRCWGWGVKGRAGGKGRGEG